MSITLPKLPMILARVSKEEHTTLEQQFRARDFEVARLVLEATADFMEMEGFGGYAVAIRALEVRHHE